MLTYKFSPESSTVNYRNNYGNDFCTLSDGDNEGWTVKVINVLSNDHRIPEVLSVLQFYRFATNYYSSNIMQREFK